MASRVKDERAPELQGFREVHRLAYACADAVAARLPLWSPYRLSGHPPQPGLWAVEPHLGFRGTGAEFEEILDVTDFRDPGQSAFWLDDDLPHVRHWAEERVAA